MKTPTAKHIITGLAITVALASVVSALILLGSPAEERMRRLDDRRVDDLERLERAVNLYWTRHARLPASLAELSEEPGVNMNLRDPETAEPYEYRVLLKADTYELCADFQRDTAEEFQRNEEIDFWLHGSGRHCFQLEARDIRDPREDEEYD
jgi:hypothetical protein